MICGWIIGNGLVEKVVACLRYCPSVDCTKLWQSLIHLVFGQDSIPAPQLQHPARRESCNLFIMHQRVVQKEKECLLETTTEEAFKVLLSPLPVNSSCKDWVKPGTSEIRTGTSRSHIRLANALRSPTAGRKNFQQQDLCWKLRGFRTCLMHY